MPRPSPLVTTFATVAVALLAGTTAEAAGPLQRRLQIDAALVRDATFTGVEQGRAQLAQSVKLQVILTSDGTPLPSNPLDPDDGRRQLERAQRTQQKVQSALARAPAAQPDPQAMAALQLQAQAMMARCGQDRDCLMREATALSAAHVDQGQPQVRAKLQAYGDAARACERQHGAGSARSEACIAEARRKAGGGVDESDEAVETPYLMFTGSADCRFDATTKIDERIDGSFGDVQGIVPFTSTTRAEGRERDGTVCPLMQAVLDTRNGRLWTHVMPALRGVPGSHVRAEKGRRPQQSDGLQSARWHEGQDWLLARLLNLNAGGSDRLERALPGGRIELQLGWKFTPL